MDVPLEMSFPGANMEGEIVGACSLQTLAEALFSVWPSQAPDA